MCEKERVTHQLEEFTCEKDGKRICSIGLDIE